MSNKNISRFFLVVMIFLLPFWFLPIDSFNLNVSKSILISVLVLLSAIFYLIHLLQEGKIKIPKSFALYVLGVLLIVVFVSSVFSGLISFSIFGNVGETGTASFFLFLFVIFCLTIQLFESKRDILRLLFFIISSSLVLFISQFVHYFLDFSFWGTLATRLDNLLGGWNELAIFFGFIALVSIVFLEFFNKKSLLFRLLLFVSLGVSLLVMIFVNFTMAWLVFGICVVMFFVYLLSCSVDTRSLIGIPLFVILISVFFILGQSLVGDMVSSVGLDSFEVRPSWGATSQIIKETLSSGVKNIVLGSGPNTFVFDWLKFKPLDINQTVFWATRFQGGIGLLPSFVATLGVLGSMAWLVFLAFFLLYGLQSINYKTEDRDTKFLLLATFLGSLYLWVFTIVYLPGQFLLILTFLITGLFFAMRIKINRIKSSEFVFVKNSTFGFASALLIVFLLISSVTVFYLFFQKYWSVYSYNNGVLAFNKGNLGKAETYFAKAVRFDQLDRYYRALSEIGIVRLSDFVNQQENLTPEESMSQLQNILAFTIQNAQNATRANSSDPLNWMMLGQVYESIIPLQIEGARTIALDSYKKALEVSPLDPRPLLASARVEIQSGNNEEARRFLSLSLNLKGDYTPSLFLLSKIAAQEGDIDNAIRQTELARLSAPNDVGILFQLGLLYYQKNDYKRAQETLERTVNINPQYSNARYFLGLSYDNLNSGQKAIEQFEFIEKLNSGNAEVKRILTNLRAGRSALSDISPPELAPEEREELPIEEEQEEE
ncbi:tetratricopeptide repeat protein [Patescibacteria group bacterium]